MSIFLGVLTRSCLCAQVPRLSPEDLGNQEANVYTGSAPLTAHRLRPSLTNHTSPYRGSPQILSSASPRGPFLYSHDILYRWSSNWTSLARSSIVLAASVPDTQLLPDLSDFCCFTVPRLSMTIHGVNPACPDVEQTLSALLIQL